MSLEKEEEKKRMAGNIKLKKNKQKIKRKNK